MNFKFFSNAPCENEPFWQFIIFPTITVLRSPDVRDRYTAINFEWLFWSAVICINNKG
jgi:hypothetical protein